jgi:hypothetical protein
LVDAARLFGKVVVFVPFQIVLTLILRPIEFPAGIDALLGALVVHSPSI